ncbi:MAG TPA: amino acid ABC transporter permease [Actinomycetes bacterium]|nr:amino acid ABC transporter permease [Actinomycetes bacterium]
MDVITSNLDDYASGFWVTIQLALVSYALALVIGTVVAIMRVSPIAPARAAGLAFVETVRNTPLPVLIVLFVFGFPKIGIRYSLFVSAIIVFSAYTGAFVSETIRSGINSVSRGQAEAARSIGLTFGQTLSQVVLPQAFRTVVPPLANLFIALTKNTSIAAAVAVAELTYRADQLNTATAQPIPVFLGAGVAYLILTLPAGFVFGAIERRVAIKR